MNKKILNMSIEHILESSSIGQLTSNTGVFFGSERKSKSAQVQLSNIQYIPAVQNGLLTVKSQTRSSDKTYDTMITFSGVKYVSPETQYAVNLETAGQPLAIMPLRIMGNDVEVKCTCLDFYWRFANYNKKNQSLSGEAPAPYVKKTDRAPNNPDEVPGACKHITKLAEQLRLENILK